MNENLKNAWIAMGIESDFGRDKNAYDPFRGSSYIGGMQIGPEVLQDRGLAQIQVLSSDSKSREVYMDEVKKRTINNETWKKWKVDDIAKRLDIEQGLKEYMTWQQGRGGVIDILTTADGGNFRTNKQGNPVKDSKGMTQRDRLIANFPDDITTTPKAKAFLESLSDEEIAKTWVELTKDKWATKKREFEDPDERAKFYRPDIQESVMDLNENIF